MYLPRIHSLRAPLQSGRISIKTVPKTTRIHLPKQRYLSTTPDWSATQYLKFHNERTRPVYDLIQQIRPHIQHAQPRIYDLGCGPGNSTAALLSAFPRGKITGIDSSRDMLSKARKTLPDIEFTQGEISTFSPSSKENVDLLFSNAVFHWLRSANRLPTVARLFTSLKPGAVLALQVPHNYNEPSHVAMRTVALYKTAPWTPYFANAHVGQLGERVRPDLDRIERVKLWYEALDPHAMFLDVWKTSYYHVLPDAGAIVEWVKGTGLQPFLNCIKDEGVKEEFLKEYTRVVGEAYMTKVRNGRVVLKYPRFFVVAVRG